MADVSMNTRYVILQRGDHGWALLQPVNARSAEAAIRSLAKAGTYVAVPSRSWQPVTVRAETKTVLTIEEATEPETPS